jgi:glycolate oxidase iron-sulfur subunit
VPREPLCCGALAAHIGAGDLAARLARATLARLAAARADWVVTAVAGCGAFLRGYDRHLDGDPRAADVARRVRDATELLAELGLPPAARPLARTITSTTPATRAWPGVREAPRRLVAAIAGVELVELPEADVCCGSAGSYNLTERRWRGLRGKIDHTPRPAPSGGRQPGLPLQIRAGLGARGLPTVAEHPLDLLAAAHLPG